MVLPNSGWLHLPLSKAEADHLFDVLKPGGPLFRFLVNRSTDTGFIYEMNPESLPVCHMTLIKGLGQEPKRASSLLTDRTIILFEPLIEEYPVKAGSSTLHESSSDLSVASEPSQDYNND